MNISFGSTYIITGAGNKYSDSKKQEKTRAITTLSDGYLIKATKKDTTLNGSCVIAEIPNEFDEGFEALHKSYLAQLGVSIAKEEDKKASLPDIERITMHLKIPSRCKYDKIIYLTPGEINELVDSIPNCGNYYFHIKQGILSTYEEEKAREMIRKIKQSNTDLGDLPTLNYSCNQNQSRGWMGTIPGSGGELNGNLINALVKLGYEKIPYAVTNRTIEEINKFRESQNKPPLSDNQISEKLDVLKENFF